MQSPLVQEPVLTSKYLAQNSNHQVWKNCLKGLVVFLIIYIIISIFLQPTIVLDKSTLKPISGASVNYYHSGMQGCSSSSIKSTHGGLVFSPLSFFRCQVSIKKDGYHLAGANKITTLPGFLGTKIIFMNKITNPQQLVKFKKVFSEGEGMDVLSYLKDSQSNFDPEKMLGNIDEDFTLKGNKITFHEKGGVQEVSHDETGNDGGSLFYDLDNVMTAPLDGYKQELEIIPGKSYIARLRDGEHYMLFYMFQHGMTAFVNPEATRVMEATTLKKVCNLYTDIYANDFSPETCYSGEYDLKVKYLRLKKEIEADHLHLLSPYLSGFAFYIKEVGTKYCFYLFPNENRYPTSGVTSLSSLDINTAMLTIKFPPYSFFKKYYDPHNSCLSVDVFVNGSYARD
jgi:hypothetical protein